VIRRLTFASCYVYSPIGTGVVCERSRLLRSLLKEADACFLAKYAVRVRQEVIGGSVELRGFFSAEDMLVPVPGSAPESKQRAWAASRLAAALVSEGVGRATWTALRRVCAVRKSAYALTGTRPSLYRHYDSFAIASPPPWQPSSIVLVDDIVTRGRTLLAAAARVHESFPNAHIKAFALVRTMGLISDVPRLLEPCRGVIRWRNNDAHRSP
jgi:predicted amidophosphoribosyltransferase